MGEAEDPEDHGYPDGTQGDDAAQDNAVDDQLQDFRHVEPPLTA
jgi:hypothetical protein